MKKVLPIALLLFLTASVLTAKALDSSYALPEALSDWAIQSNSWEKSGRKVTSHAIYSPDRTHVITIGFVTGYTDKEITDDHFDALITSFAREGLKELKEKKHVTMYGLKGAQVIARGVIQEKEFKGKGVILKSGESELTIMMFAIGADLEDAQFGMALSGLALASN